MNFSALSSEALLIIIAWTLAWKGIALWKSARRNHKYWYIVILVLGMFGVLEMIYLYFFEKKDTKSSTTKSSKKKATSKKSSKKKKKRSKKSS